MIVRRAMGNGSDNGESSLNVGTTYTIKLEPDNDDGDVLDPDNGDGDGEEEVGYPSNGENVRADQGSDDTGAGVERKSDDGLPRERHGGESRQGGKRQDEFLNELPLLSVHEPMLMSPDSAPFKDLTHYYHIVRDAPSYWHTIFMEALKGSVLGLCTNRALPGAQMDIVVGLRP